MKLLFVLFAFCATVVVVNGSKRHHHNKQPSSEHAGKCPRRKLCGKGKECRLNSNRQAQCVCIEKCPEFISEKEVCGSDGKIYTSICELHRFNCISGETISVDSFENCDESQQQQQRPTNSLCSPDEPCSQNALLPSRSSLCSPEEFEILKDNLLLYNHEHLEKKPSGKDFLLSLMFSHFDRNNNGGLDYTELQSVMDEEEIGRLAPAGCSLTHLFQYEDTDNNDIIDLNEFYVAFNELYTVSLITLDKAVEITRITAQVGDNVELKCDVHGIPPIPPRFVWKRFEVDLSTQDDHQIRVFPDGTLYLSNVQLLHTGNYTCHGERNSHVVQTHVLTVQSPPDVHVSPHIIMRRPGTNVTMQCRVTAGEPFPTVRWLKNDDPIVEQKSSDKYSLAKNNLALTLTDVYFSDTGAYMCECKNANGRRIDITSLVVVAGQGQTEDSLQSDSYDDEGGFFVFHENGISIYDPGNCRLSHQIQATDIIPGTQDYVCSNDPTPKCNWGSAVKVASSYVYVSQPLMDRILIISISQMVVVDVVSTDRYPVELSYLSHLDQVWVQCWRTQETGQKTLQVIRDAKEKKKHHTVHPEPINSHFDVVQNLFLPPDTKSSSQFRYGYVTHKNNRGFYKLDLVALRYVKSIDLTLWNCVPQHVEFSGLYGIIIMECREPVTGRQTGEIVFDALTDSVVHYKGDRFGKPYLTPDSRQLVTVSHDATGTTLLIQRLTENGLQFAFDVKTSLKVCEDNAVAFFPSKTAHTYDLFASSVDKQDVLFVDLETGKVEMVTGGTVQSKQSSPNQQSTPVQYYPWNKPEERPISSQSLFSKYLVTRTQDSVYVINGNSHTINCQISGLSSPSLILWI